MKLPRLWPARAPSLYHQTPHASISAPGKGSSSGEDHSPSSLHMVGAQQTANGDFPSGTGAKTLLSVQRGWVRS